MKKVERRTRKTGRKRKNDQIPNPDLIRLGREVRRRRDALGISQEELGFRAGLHRNYIGYVERAECNATMKRVIKIARALGLRPAGLLREMEWKK
jgi:transcriptional regulator with XRE-family HTH domain